MLIIDAASVQLRWRANVAEAYGTDRREQGTEQEENWYTAT